MYSGSFRTRLTGSAHAGNDLDFDMGLYFFEQLCLFIDQPDHPKFKPTGLTQWSLANPQFRTKFMKSLPKMETSIVRKKELRDMVDVNFDGRVSMLEYLLYQYNASPKDLMDRSSTCRAAAHAPPPRRRCALLRCARSLGVLTAHRGQWALMTASTRRSRRPVWPSPKSVVV